jgi:hypothetical protein
MGFTGVDSGLRKAITPAAASQAALEDHSAPIVVNQGVDNPHVG